MKECFGKIIKDSQKMEECRRCELLEECKALNWQSSVGNGEEADETFDRADDQKSKPMK